MYMIRKILPPRLQTKCFLLELGKMEEAVWGGNILRILQFCACKATKTT